jgi:preprotein translocase subunit SecF
MATETKEHPGPSPEPRPTDDSGFKRFFTNQSRFEFIGRSRTWLIVSLALVAICIAGVLVRGLNFGIDFTGGAAFVATDLQVEVDADDLRDEIGALGIDDVQVQVVDDGDGVTVNVPPLEETPATDSDVLDVLEAETGVDRTAVDISVVGPRWGEQISEQALQALAVFLVLVVIYISVRFEWRMALAALVTLLHDVIVTVGVYAIVGFQVSPASVIALLTILGYSLYDTVVIFDRVRDESGHLNMTSNETYGEAANRSVNEVLLRSLSTSITSLLPVGCLLLIGANLLGADTLQDLALALFVGMAVGTYSSIFVATPLMVWLKEKEPRYAELKEKILARRGGEAAAAVASSGRKDGDDTAKASGGRKPSQKGRKRRGN